MWRYERGRRERLEMRWIGEQQALVSSREPQLLLGREAIVRREPRLGGVSDMRNMILVAVMGLLSAVLYAREPMGGPMGEEVVQGSPVATPMERRWPVGMGPATQVPGTLQPGGQWPTQAGGPVNPPVPPEVRRAPNMMMGGMPTANPTIPPPGVIPNQPTK